MDAESLPPERREPPRWSPQAKAVASVLVALHVTAVFLAPMWFASGASSPAVAPLIGIMRPYIDALFLNHGYAFFAPDPGPSHLVEYRLEFDDGRPAEQGRFPDLNEQWPRLMYHRHFMLSESLYTYYAPAEQPPLADDVPAEERESERQRWEERRRQYEALHDSMARHLQAAHHASRVELHRIEHRLLPPVQFTSERDPRRPYRLNDERTYVDLDAPPPSAARQREGFVPGLTPLPETLP